MLIQRINAYLSLKLITLLNKGKIVLVDSYILEVLIVDNKSSI